MRQRQNFIADRIARGATVCREDIVLAFEVSTQQASLDLRRFQETHPGAIVYDKSLKRYVAAGGAEP